eukprot:jgi/Ulvmu1/1377/UM011_0105.1
MEAEGEEGPRAEDSVAQEVDQREPDVQSSAPARRSSNQYMVYAAVGWIALDAALGVMRILAARMSSIKGCARRLRSQGQHNLAEVLLDLDGARQRTLLRSIKGVSFGRLDELFQQALQDETMQAADPEPLGLDDVLTLAGRSEDKADAWNSAGLVALSQGDAAVLVLAGGQGTRLGTSDPKGCFDIGLPSGKSLFHLQAERIQRLQALAKRFVGAEAGSCRVLWYILTSAATHAATLAYLEAHHFFGLDRGQVFVFQQASLPCLTEDGHAIVQSDGSIATAPDGNGGVYLALRASGALRHMRARGVRCVDCCSVDNAAARLGDPVFLGACLLHGADLGARTVAKASPGEKVGVLARRKGNLEVVEYSEISASQAAARDARGRLRFNWSNICMHYFSVAWLHDVAKHVENGGARYHIARKQIPSREGPVQGIKLEQFIFDVFPLAQRAVLMEVRRSEEFAPVKNASAAGVADSPETARAALLALHRRWVEDAGGAVTGGRSAGVEVSPLVSYAGEGLGERCASEAFDANSHID